MIIDQSKVRFIRDEFDCFVHIGMNAQLRATIEQTSEAHSSPSNSLQPIPVIYFEVRDIDGSITEMWHLEPDKAQFARLVSFLNRFSVQDVKLMHTLLHVT